MSLWHPPTRSEWLILIGLAGAIAGCTPPAPPDLPALPANPTGVPVAYLEQVEPVLENRCVVCHGCNDAPCQLQFSSFEGLERGASKTEVYHSERLTAADPSRLFIDARSTAAWRERGFFSVLDVSDAAGASPLLLGMLALGQQGDFVPDAPLPDTIELDITRELACPAPDEFAAYAREHPHGGMPYATAALTPAELGVIANWVAQGAPAPPPAAPLAAATARRVAAWEEFLNGDSRKARITARYLYEHWFLAHLHFEAQPDAPFFRIVRSSTPPGSPVDEIATRRPTDSPGEAAFWYRLTPVDEAIVRKTHIVYPLSPAKLQRLTELFLAAEWEPTRLPGYERETASNPFITFAEMPARSRYQYMLDEAQYFVESFIRGPVCRGQVAVDVIEDHFFVSFMDPDVDFASNDPRFLERTAGLLALPAQHGSELIPDTLPAEYQRQQARYLEIVQEYYDAADPEHVGPELSFIWDGDGHNTNAQLTVFRNFDNATVLRGFRGEIPKTAWVMDYPIFERIYYDLVAGFDVYGNVTHQLTTRLYMDHLRMQSEELFLAFLPEPVRAPLHASWYVGATDTLDYRYGDRERGFGHGTRIPFETGDPKRELIELLVARNAVVAGPPDLLNRCAGTDCDRPGASELERRVERALRPLAGVRGPWVAKLPEVTLVRVHQGAPGGAAVTYTLMHTRAHTNVASLFNEDERLVPGDDSVVVLRGIIGSYPNFAMDVEAGDIESFATALQGVADEPGLTKLVERWGVRRTSPRFWQTLDAVSEELRRERPVQAGILDINRYENL